MKMKNIMLSITLLGMMPAFAAEGRGIEGPDVLAGRRIHIPVDVRVVVPRTATDVEAGWRITAQRADTWMEWGYGKFEYVRDGVIGASLGTTGLLCVLLGINARASSEDVAPIVVAGGVTGGLAGLGYRYWNRDSTRNARVTTEALQAGTQAAVTAEVQAAELERTITELRQSLQQAVERREAADERVAHALQALGELRGVQTGLVGLAQVTIPAWRAVAARGAVNTAEARRARATAQTSLVTLDAQIQSLRQQGVNTDALTAQLGELRIEVTAANAAETAALDALRPIEEQATELLGAAQRALAGEGVQGQIGGRIDAAVAMLQPPRVLQANVDGDDE